MKGFKKTSGSSVESAIDAIVKDVRRQNMMDSYCTSPTLIGITGEVASGKTYFARKLAWQIQKQLDVESIIVPFDYWIIEQERRVANPIYPDKFYLERLGEDIRDLSSGRPYYQPLFDVQTRKEARIDEQKLVSRRKEACLSQVKKHRGRQYLRVPEYDQQLSREYREESQLETYINLKDGRLEKQVIPNSRLIYLINGALILHDPPNIVDCFSHRIYVTASWEERVIRMIRKFKRGEQHSKSGMTLKHYLRGYKEGKEKGDEKFIEAQRSKVDITVYNQMQNLAELLDMIDVMAMCGQGQIDEDIVALTQIEIHLEQFYEHLQATDDINYLEKICHELNSLLQVSYHLPAEMKSGLSKVRDILLSNSTSRDIIRRWIC